MIGQVTWPQAGTVANVRSRSSVADPLYRQIADELRRKIDSGEYGRGAQLPTEDELIEEHGASRNTVRGAIRELTTLGVVYTLHGKGTFVTELVNSIVTTLTTDPETGAGGGEGLVYTAEVARSRRIATTGATQVVEQPADSAIAGTLKIAKGTKVISRHEPRFVDSHPWSLQTSYYPKWLAQRAPRLQQAPSIEEGTVAYLATCGFRQVGYRDGIEVRAPIASEIEFFEVPSDGRVQVVEIYRVAFDQDARRIRLTITVYRADRNRFVIDVGDVPRRTGLLPAGDENSVQKSNVGFGA
jgi:GntR family transcriptional regulator